MVPFLLAVEVSVDAQPIKPDAALLRRAEVAGVAGRGTQDGDPWARAGKLDSLRTRRVDTDAS